MGRGRLFGATGEIKNFEILTEFLEFLQENCLNVEILFYARNKRDLTF